ncbi:hypothetical protein NADFUDRAFT_47380, partial [Nadsonia fulvescens var. elongata DSM 6958]
MNTPGSASLFGTGTRESHTQSSPFNSIINVNGNQQTSNHQSYGSGMFLSHPHHHPSFANAGGMVNGMTVGNSLGMTMNGLNMHGVSMNGMSMNCMNIHGMNMHGMNLNHNHMNMINHMNGMNESNGMALHGTSNGTDSISSTTTSTAGNALRGHSVISASHQAFANSPLVATTPLSAGTTMNSTPNDSTPSTPSHYSHDSLTSGPSLFPMYNNNLTQMSNANDMLNANLMSVSGVAMMASNNGNYRN